jgi:hypothetical protein
VYIFKNFMVVAIVLLFLVQAVARLSSHTHYGTLNLNMTWCGCFDEEPGP